MATSSYQQLRVWQNGMDLVRLVYIAEGHTRGTTKEFLRYVTMAHGSLAELETMVLIARDLQYLDTKNLDELTALCGATGRMLGSLRRALMKKLDPRRTGVAAPQIPKSLNP